MLFPFFSGRVRQVQGRGQADTSGCARGLGELQGHATQAHGCGCAGPGVEACELGVFFPRWWGSVSYSPPSSVIFHY
jgi:hypothetical protein